LGIVLIYEQFSQAATDHKSQVALPFKLMVTYNWIRSV